MTGKRKLEPPLKLDLSFDEALSRFVATKPKEIVESIERAKTKKPSQDAPPRRPGRPKRRALKRF
jgi:hypothetical protein